MNRNLFFILAAVCFAAPVFAASSVFTARLDDPRAVYLDAPELGAQGDGQADESGRIQAAIDKAESSAREGIVFVPSGRYRLTLPSMSGRVSA